MAKQKHTEGRLDVFVGNADGRGLIRLEIQGTGQHIASMPRGKQSEADAMRLSSCWNLHDEMAKALRNVCSLFGPNERLSGDFQYAVEARAILAKLDAQS